MSARSVDAGAKAEGSSPRARRAWLNTYMLVGGLMVLLLVALTVLAPLLAPKDPNAINPINALKPFGFEGHVLGTDNLGRDLFSRMLYGGLITLLSGAVAAFLSVGLGVLLGVLGAYFGGWTDLLIARLLDILMGFPFILLAILFVAAAGPSTLTALVAVAIANVPFSARLVRSEALRVREQEYITAASALGASHGRVMLRHLLPNVASIIIPTLFMTMGWMIGQTSALSFLGLGTQPPTADWGSMLAESQNYMTSLPEVAMLPGLAIVFAVLGLNLFGVGLRAMLLRER